MWLHFKRRSQNSLNMFTLAVKGVIYNQEEIYLGLENQRQFWGGGGQQRGSIGGGGDCISKSSTLPESPEYVAHDDVEHQ